MTPFLRQVAETYMARERESMMDFCFVFPNKRSGVFFRSYLAQLAGGKPMVLPQISTIGEVVSEFTSLTEASRLDQIFTLYNEYRQLSSDIADFDKFLFWGEMILSDFNDVDRDLVDPNRLFVNLKRYREVSANYLTPEQREILTRYWGEQFDDHSPDEFWRHLHHDAPTELEKKFLKLWEVLAPLYERFTTRLLERDTATQGKIMREAIARLRDVPTADLKYKRFIFVGFNVLTLSEIKLFENLKARGVADFYWDLASPVLRAKGNRGARFLGRNAKLFGSRYDLAELYPMPDDYFPEIDVIGIPSGIGQAKAAGKRLTDWIADGTVADPADAIETAVVLPDESLFIPMIHAVPEEYKSLNVTMGLPMRSTSFASFIASVVAMQLRSHKAYSDDQRYFFYEDVKALASHPLLRMADEAGCDRIMTRMVSKRLYQVPVKLLTEVAPVLTPVFTPIADNNSTHEVYGYFTAMLRWLLDIVAPLAQVVDPDDPDAEPGVNERVRAAEAFFIECYLEALDQLKSAVDRHRMVMKDSTFIQLLQKAIAGSKVNLRGEPLSGLQVMGVLETRALDFDNIIILSMNERIFPRKHYSRSFIPENLRRAYGMATTEHQESIYSYYFYRLISRASHVTLYYDARNSGGKSNELSRYIAQMLYLFPEAKITHTLQSYDLKLREVDDIVVRKTPEIMAQLREFRPEGGKRTLSASSINDYINCPLSFYLKRLCRLDLDETTMEYMDSPTYGSIVHKVVESIYSGFQGSNKEAEVVVTPEMLGAVIRHGSKLDKLITMTVNEIYNHREPGDLSPRRGETQVLGKIIRHTVVNLLRCDMDIAPFDFIAAEFPLKGEFLIEPSEGEPFSINISQIIDRIDRVADRLRIVDYKTGSDRTVFSDMDDLFDNTNKERRKAILQLLFYCNAYARERKLGSQPIQPILYSLKGEKPEGFGPLKVGPSRGKKEDLLDYLTVNQEFLQRFNDTVAEIFNPDIPFIQAPKADNCHFCSFKEICRKK